MTKYSPIWEQLKTHGHVTLAVPAPLHKRVWKGLINCKYKDVMFKYESDLIKKRYVMSYIAEQSRIRIVLKCYSTVSELSVEDL